MSDAPVPPAGENVTSILAKMRRRADMLDDWKGRELLLELESALRAGADALAPSPQKDLTFAQFSEVNRQRCESPDGFKHRLDSWSTSDWFLAAVGELGEAANIAKKLNRYRDGIPGNKESEAALRDKLRRELGDVYVYLDLLAQSLGVDIGAAAVDVFNAKSEEIGCPIRVPAPPRADAREAPRQSEVQEKNDDHAR